MMSPSFAPALLIAVNLLGCVLAVYSGILYQETTEKKGWLGIFIGIIAALGSLALLFIMAAGLPIS